MLGDKVKELRKMNHITQQQLAKALNLSQSTIGMMEKNKQGASKKTLMKIADFFNVTVDFLLSDEEMDIDTNKLSKHNQEVETIAAHLATKNITPKKAKLLKDYIDALFDEEF